MHVRKQRHDGKGIKFLNPDVKLSDILFRKHLQIRDFKCLYSLDLGKDRQHEYDLLLAFEIL